MGGLGGVWGGFERPGQALGRLHCVLRGSWGRLGVVLEVSCAVLRRKLGVLGGSWRILEVSWDHLGASWAVLGRSWEHFWSILWSFFSILEGVVHEVSFLT